MLGLREKTIIEDEIGIYNDDNQSEIVIALILLCNRLGYVVANGDDGFFHLIEYSQE